MKEYDVSEECSDRNKKWPQFLVTIVVSVISFSTGIHYGWPSPSLPKLLSEEFTLNVTSEDISYVTSTSFVGDIIAFAMWSILADLIGRKMAFLLTIPCYIISLLFIYFSSHSIVLLYMGRIIGGVGEGAVISLSPTYIGEISEPRIRGILFSCITAFWCTGILFVNIIGSYFTIETTSLIALVFPIIFLVTFSPMPETPFYHLMKNKVEDARESLKKLRWNENVEEELVTLESDVSRQMSEKGRYQDLFLIKTHRKALLLGSSVMVTEALCGMSSLIFYAQLFFVEATDIITEEWAASLMIVIKLVLTVVSSGLIDVVGRKPLLLSSIAGSFLMLIFLSTFFLFKDYSSLNVQELNWMPLLGMIMFVTIYNIGLGNITVWIAGELFSTNMRAKGVGTANIFYAIATILSTQIYQGLADNYSLGPPLLIFAVAQLLGFVLILKYLPETKGKTLEQIQQLVNEAN